MTTLRGAGGFALSGQRAAGTEILLDGIENVDNYDATVGQQIPIDSVQEYRIITNGFDAQYGRAGGGIVNLVTKTGTNKVHGSLYEYNRISALASHTYNENAQNAFNSANGLATVPADHFTRNQFGYSVGGPIARDKLFFFSNTEWNRIRSRRSGAVRSSHGLFHRLFKCGNSSLLRSVWRTGPQNYRRCSRSRGRFRKCSPRNGE